MRALLHLLVVTSALAIGCGPRSLPPCEGESCIKLGWSYRTGNGVEKDLELAVRIFQRSCSAGYGDACKSLGDVYQHGPGAIADYVRAKELYETACNLGSGDGCRSVASIEERRGHTARAADMHERACRIDRRFEGSCFVAASMRVSLRGEQALKGIAYFQSACEGADSLALKIHGCVVLADLFERGDPVIRDEKRAKEARERACDAGDVESCGAIALRFVLGIGAAYDEQRAAKELAKACDKGHPVSCLLADRVQNATNDRWLVGRLAEVTGDQITVEHQAGRIPEKGMKASSSVALTEAGSSSPKWIVNAEGEVMESSPSEVVFASGIQLRFGLPKGTVVWLEWNKYQAAVAR